ncbi:hypothetical protein BY996DRAFT_6413368 [Phakopsora pachyrhizi]|nr:hypothetical protein BY996DRAFT_6413368 [Phakopsora pachyrhizi]
MYPYPYHEQIKPEQQRLLQDFSRIFSLPIFLFSSDTAGRLPVGFRYALKESAETLNQVKHGRAGDRRTSTSRLYFSLTSSRHSQSQNFMADSAREEAILTLDLETNSWQKKIAEIKAEDLTLGKRSINPSLKPNPGVLKPSNTSPYKSPSGKSSTPLPSQPYRGKKYQLIRSLRKEELDVPASLHQLDINDIASNSDKPGADVKSLIEDKSALKTTTQSATIPKTISDSNKMRTTNNLISTPSVVSNNSTPDDNQPNGAAHKLHLSTADVVIIVFSIVILLGCSSYLLFRNRAKLTRFKNSNKGSSNSRSRTFGLENPPVYQNHDWPSSKQESLFSVSSKKHSKERGFGSFEGSRKDSITVPEATFNQSRPTIQRRLLRRLAGISTVSHGGNRQTVLGRAKANATAPFESFIKRWVRDDAEAKLMGEKRIKPEDSLSPSDKANLAGSEGGYQHPLGTFATLHDWGSESQV